MRYPLLQSRVVWFFFVVATAVGGALFFFWAGFRGTTEADIRSRTDTDPHPIAQGRIVNWWGFVPDEIRAQSLNSITHSNIERADYSGAESCRKCHQRNYADWSKHPHRWMNAVADRSTVMGDFSGRSTISYRGGTARFFRERGEYRMRLERGDVRRVYRISQTIGSRFYQYYVGTLISGPEPENSPHYSVDHVLPFGYWLEQKEWIPTVHVHWVTIDGSPVDEEDLPSTKRPDPFAGSDGPLPLTEYFRCNHCHTTFPLGDLLVRNAKTLGRHLSIPLHVDVPRYLKAAHPQLAQRERPKTPPTNAEILRMRTKIWKFDARTHAVNLGISCEACHLGSREHAKGKMAKPYFFPRNRNLYVQFQGEMDYGRTQRNLNWVCARCHSGNRRQLAGGMATWNSTECTDAMRGSCYSKLKCVDCHDPHKATGRKWARSADHDDRLCLKCHIKFEPVEKRVAHTHHPVGSSGARCMNCHMPRINEGLQDVVRTHMIYSPTNRQMIEANHPNACNQCHTKEPIDWTLKYLHEWYGTSYNFGLIARNYPEAKRSVALGWLKSRDQSVRLIAADTLARTNSRWALPQLIEALDDPYLLNRQFARRALESMMGIRLEKHGYRFFMDREERRKPLEKIRRALLPAKPMRKRASRDPPASRNADGRSLRKQGTRIRDG